MDDVYELFQRGMRLLEAGDFNQATVPLGRAAAIEPEKTSIREALGRALMECGRPGEARKPLVLAACLRPDRRDYRIYRDRARARAA